MLAQADRELNVERVLDTQVTGGKQPEYHRAINGTRVFPTRELRSLAGRGKALAEMRRGLHPRADRRVATGNVLSVESVKWRESRRRVY